MTLFTLSMGIIVLFYCFCNKLSSIFLRVPFRARKDKTIAVSIVGRAIIKERAIPKKP